MLGELKPKGPKKKTLAYEGGFILGSLFGVIGLRRGGARIDGSFWA